MYLSVRPSSFSAIDIDIVDTVSRIFMSIFACHYVITFYLLSNH
jgi:hypothetical protein